MARWVNRKTFSATLEGYLNDLQVLERRLTQWLDQSTAFPYDAFARSEREGARVEITRLLLVNRMVVTDGASRAVQSAQALVDQNPDSWRRGENLMLLGETYESIARDWTAAHPPDGLRFDAEGGWSDWVALARVAYQRAAQSDGDPAKPEAQARLRALDAYALRMSQRSR